jgi:hypothetical protein
MLNEQYCLLGYDAMQCGRCLATFVRSLLLPSSGLKFEAVGFSLPPSYDVNAAKCM